MKKPLNYDQIKTGIKGYESLEIGGHECVVLNALETVSKAGNEMLVVDLDTAPTDRRPNFYKKRYITDTWENKTWGCRVYFVNDGSEINDRKRSIFVSAVCEANGIDDNKFDWGSIDKVIKGKKVCAVFRQEEYEKQDGSVGVGIKPYTYRAMEDFKAGKIQAPKKKEIQKNSVDDIEPVNSDTMPF